MLNNSVQWCGCRCGSTVHTPVSRQVVPFVDSAAHLRPLLLILAVVFISLGQGAAADDSLISIIRLPPLTIQDQPARAHTQGLELISGSFYVTARRDDVQPRRALLLRTSSTRSDWDVWDITPIDSAGALTSLDHPGGMQSDGSHLWIPIAESRRNGRSVIRRYRLGDLVSGKLSKAEFEFQVNDHIGAVAVFAQRKILLGATWDTETVYVWEFTGQTLHLQQTIAGPDLAARGLGVVNGQTERDRRAGLAVQDWKALGDRLFASGLFRGGNIQPGTPQSQLVSYADFLRPHFQRRVTSLPGQPQTELAREGMALSSNFVHFLPEDLGVTNRIFRLPIEHLE